AKEGFGPKLMQFERPAAPNSSPSHPVDAMPDEYLLLKAGRSSSFSKPRQIYASAGGPLELRFVDAQRNDLVPVSYPPFNPPPAAWPLLTTIGWYRGSNIATTEEHDAIVRAFLNGALMSPGRRTASAAPDQSR